MALPLGFITVILVRYAILAKQRKAVTGEEGMIGLVGVAQTDLGTGGKGAGARRTVAGARPAEVIERRLRQVRQVDGLTLVVESAPESL